MPTLIVRHRVSDFATWLEGHEERKALFASAVSSFKTFQDQEDPDSILLVLEVVNMEKLGEVLNDPAHKAIKDKHTVLSPIVVSLQVPV
jgi:hypothetical protein